VRHDRCHRSGPAAHEFSQTIEESPGVGSDNCGRFQNRKEGRSPPRGRKEWTNLSRVLGVKVLNEFTDTVPLVRRNSGVHGKGRFEHSFPHFNSTAGTARGWKDSAPFLSTTPDKQALMFIRRILDVILSSSCLVLCRPLIMLRQRFSSNLHRGGQGLVPQQRCGLNGAVFTMYKFRSMVNKPEQHRFELRGAERMGRPPPPPTPMSSIFGDPRRDCHRKIAPAVQPRRISSNSLTSCVGH